MSGAAVLSSRVLGQGSPVVCGTAQGIILPLPFCARLRALSRPPGASMPLCSEELLIQLKVGSAGKTMWNA